MSVVNLFSALSHKSAAAPSQIAAPVVADWRDAPIAVPGSGQRCAQFVTLTRLLRSKDLLQITDPAIRTLVANVAVYDDELGHWTELPNLTKGQASDLIAALKPLPKIGFSTVTTAAAEPIAPAARPGPGFNEPAPKPRKATKSAEIKTPALGVHETADGLRFEVYKTAKGQIRTRMV